MGVVVHIPVCVSSYKILKWWDGSPAHECLILSKKFTEDLNSSVLLVLLLRALPHHGVSFFKGDLSNALYEISGVVQVGIRSSLQCVQHPDQIPC